MTFLFTDLESSTVGWESHPDAMANALERHDKLLRRIIEANGGYIFSTAGDAFAAAFASGAGAAEAAAVAQHALRAEQWPEPVRLACRMGLHTGSAHERDDNYFGPAVNRAARIMATGSGGQVLMSAATAALLGAENVVLHDLGVHRLRDLLAPEHLYQLVVDADEGAHPPLRSLEYVDHNLPSVRSSLHGREGEVESLREELRRPGILTLTGPGGVGKTRLALEVAARDIDAFDGIYFVDLAVVTDSETVAAAVVGALGIAAGEGIGAATRMLLARSAAVILDNCEHLIDAVAALAEDICQRCPRCTILVTSREPLGVDGERVWRVPSLPEHAAAELFLERAVAARPDLIVDEAARVATYDVIRRLDGLPLALELAAARASHLSIVEISAHLDERFELLTGGRRRARARHQTLLAAMDWSYDLLTCDEQSLLRACSVFLGGFTLEALTGVADLPRPLVLDRLGSLVQKSLVLANQFDGGTTRYHLLETVRLYGQERLVAAGEATDRRERHARWFINNGRSERDVVVGGWTIVAGEMSPEPFHDRDNVMAALEWCDDHGDLVAVGQLSSALNALVDMYEWSDTAWRYLGREDVLRALSNTDQAYYLFASAQNANSLGDFAVQRSYAERALPLVDPSPLRALILCSQSVAVSVIDAERAERIADEVLAFVPAGSAIAYEALQLKAGAATMRGDLNAAIALREHGDPEGFAMTELAIALHLRGRHEQVGQLLAASAAAHETRWFAYRWCMLATLEHAAAGEFDLAVDAGREALRFVDRFPGRMLDRDVLVAVAALAYWRSDARRCALLLAVDEQTLTMRSPGSWQLYLHYRRLARAALTADEVAAARAEARSLTVHAALAQELGNASV